MIPIPVRPGIGVRIARRIDTEVRAGPCSPRTVLSFAMADDMIAVFRPIEFIGDMTRDAGGGLIKRFRIPRGIAGETFVFRSCGIGVPTTCVPRVIRFGNHLRDFASGRVGGGVFFSVDAVMNARARAAVLKIRDRGGVIAFHVVNDVEFVAVAGSIPMAAADRIPNGRAIIRTAGNNGNRRDKSGTAKESMMFHE